jgi:hypothetical protein
MRMKSQGHSISHASKKWIALLTANVYSHSDTSRRHYCAFQSAITGWHFETRDPIAFVMVPPEKESNLWEWMALIIGNIYSYPDPARGHYCAFQMAFNPLHLEIDHKALLLKRQSARRGTGRTIRKCTGADSLRPCTPHADPRTRRKVHRLPRAHQRLYSYPLYVAPNRVA